MPVQNLSGGVEVFTANCFLVEGKRTALVDPGPVPDLVERARSRVEELDCVVVTHGHRDHVAGLEAVAEAFDPEVYCYGDHPLRTRRLRDGDELTLGNDIFTAMHVPGHREDHVALLSDTAVFTGDIVVYRDSAFEDGSFGRTDRPGQSRERLIESLRRLLDEMPPSVEHLYPGHGPVHRGDIRSVVQRALRRAERREPKYG